MASTKSESQLHAITRSLAKKALAPLAASAAAYGARQLPRLFEQHVLPRVRELGVRDAVEGVAAKSSDSLQRMTHAITETQAVRTVTDAASRAVGSNGTHEGANHTLPTQAEREEARRQREARRNDRRKAS